MEHVLKYHLDNSLTLLAPLNYQDLLEQLTKSQKGNMKLDLEIFNVLDASLLGMDCLSGCHG